MRYKQSILVSRQSTKEYQNINFAQWSVDNVDHNIATLTRHGTFHGIGIIETVTTGEIKLNPIKRLRDRKLINEVINNCGKVPIVQYTPGLNNNTGYKFLQNVSSVKYHTKTMLLTLISQGLCCI